MTDLTEQSIEDRLFNEYVLPHLEVVSAEESFNGKPVYVSDLEEIKTGFMKLITRYGLEREKETINEWFNVRKPDGEVRLKRPDGVVLLPLTSRDIEGLKIRLAQINKALEDMKYEEEAGDHPTSA